MKQKQKLTTALTTAMTWLVAMSSILASSIFASSMTTGEVPQRSDIQTKYTWDLGVFYEDDAAWEADFNLLKEGIAGFEQYRGKLAESPDHLLGALQLNDSLDVILSNLYVYAGLKLDEDQRRSEYQEMSGRIRGLYAQLSAANSFIEPEILAINNDKLLSWLNQHPELTVFRFYLENLIRSKEHILSQKEEEILALAGPLASSPGEIFGMINNADIDYGTVVDEDGNEVALTKERYSKLLESRNRDVRRRVNEAYNQAYLNYENTLAATLASSVKKDWFYAQARKYNSCLEMALDGSNIPPDVFHNLIDAANSNLEPIHKWASLRKRILGVDTLYTYDLWAPLLDRESTDYPYDEAVRIVLDGVKPLGTKYCNDLAKGFDSRWVDVYETEGKESGAYCWGSGTSHPVVLLNYNNTLNYVFTVAHEMGHAMHHEYTRLNEPNLYAGHYTFTAEVASTVNEALLIKKMLDNTTDRDDRIELLIHYIEQIIGTFYTQVMFSEFEMAIHDRVEEGGAISADFLRETYRNIYQKYWGPELVIDEINDLGGMRIPHFYSQFYVYQYATCYAAAQALSHRILNDEPGALDAYHNFLATGRSKYPVDILRDAGVDMTRPEPITRTIDLLGELVDEVERLLDEA